jgi:L-iditol 2-dehydrogenase
VSGCKDPAIYALSEPLACCINGYEQIGDISGAHVAIFGAGPIGVMLAGLARYYGCKSVTIFDVKKERINFVKEHQFADKCIHIGEDNLDQYQNFNVVFTACTSGEAQKDALKVAAKAAKINFFGGLPVTKKNVVLDTNLIHYNELIVTGSHGSTPKQHQLAVNLIEKEKIDLSKLITKSFELKEFNQAYNLAASGEAMKVVFRPGM